MSPFNKCLEICESQEAKALFRACYWARNSKTRNSKESQRVKALSLLETISEDDRRKTSKAVCHWNSQTTNRIHLPLKTSMDN